MFIRCYRPLLSLLVLLSVVACKSEKKGKIFNGSNKELDALIKASVNRSIAHLLGQQKGSGAFLTDKKSPVFQTSFALQALSKFPFEAGTVHVRLAQTRAAGYLKGVADDYMWPFMPGLPPDMHVVSHGLLALATVEQLDDVWFKPSIALARKEVFIPTWVGPENYSLELLGSSRTIVDWDMLVTLYFTMFKYKVELELVAKFAKKLAAIPMDLSKLQSKWYYSRYFAPSRLVWFLKQVGHSSPNQAAKFKKIATWAASQIQSNGDCESDKRWQTASNATCYLTLLLVDREKYLPQIEAGIRKIIQDQKHNGSWGTEPFVNRTAFDYSKMYRPYDSTVYTITLVHELYRLYYGEDVL